MRDIEKPIMFVKRTNAQLADQGYTYNQAGFSYNQTGVQFGGVYGNEIMPLSMNIVTEKPHVAFSNDIYTPAGTALVNSGMLIGMLGLLYP